MERRKSSMDANKGTKYILRHPITTGLQHKSNHIVRHVRKSTPKIKLNANDKSSDFRSISSPRLKNFPAEEVRKVRKSPRPNVFPFPTVLSVSSSPTQTTPLLTNNNSNYGQGDTVPESILSPPIFHNFNLNQTISQPFLSHPTSNETQHSDVIPHYNTIQRSPDQQNHRPFVPNIVYNLNPKLQINSDNQIIESSNINNQIEDTKTPDECDIQLQDDFQHPSKFLETISCEKQPVGGRNAELHRAIHLSKEKQLKNLPISQPNIISQSNVSPEQKDHYQYQKQMQPTYYYDYYHRQKPNICRTTVGMTSPQDLIINSSAKNSKNNCNPNSKHQSHSPSMTQKNVEHHCSYQYNKKIAENNQHLNHSLVSQQQNLSEYPPRRSVNNNKKKVKKNLQYTPAMIHDQELLVIKMRQQGINEEIMKRQFNTLLNEQQRQLLYQQQFVQIEEKQEEFDDVEIQRRRRINKIEDDEKPDWMKHITPSWIPYALVEETKNNTKKEGKKSVRINENDYQQQEQCHKYNTHVNVQQCNIVPHNIYQQLPNLINNHEQQYENTNYHINLCNSEQCTTEQFPNVNPTSILKTRNNNSSMIKQKEQQNNGLQDWESVKEAMVELKNVQNQKGFEYLMNSSKKEQTFQLNGVQDPDDPLMQNLPYQLKPDRELQETPKEPSANGLENKRNFNNPPPPPSWHLKNCKQPMSEYPRRKLNNKNNIDNRFVMPAEKEDGTISWQNVVVGDNVRNKNSILGQDCYQVKGEIGGLHNYAIPCNIVRSNSLPPNMYSECQPIRFNNFHGVLDNIHNNHMPSIRPNEVVQQYVQPNIQMQQNIRRPEQLFEARIIGGVKYFARKSEYTPQPHVHETLISCGIPNQPIAFH